MKGEVIIKREDHANLYFCSTLIIIIVSSCDIATLRLASFPLHIAFISSNCSWVLFYLICLRDLNLSTKLFGSIVTVPSGTSPTILAGDPATIEKGGMTISAGTVVPFSTRVKSFNMHL